MRPVSDIISLKINELKISYAELGRRLGGLTGQAIGKYLDGQPPKLEFAVRWKEVFGENLISLMFEEPSRKEEVQEILIRNGLVADPEEKYERIQEKVIRLQDELLDCHKVKEELRRERDDLKNFIHTTREKSKLKKEKK